MKTILLLLLPINFLFTTDVDCTSIKTGKFKLSNDPSGTTMITRTVDEQIEENKDLGLKIRYKVKWIDDCTYQLFEAKIRQGDKSFIGQKSDTLTVNITEVNTSYYKVMTTSNFSDLSVEAKLEILK